MWTSEIIRARPTNERGDYSIAVSPDGTRHMSWNDSTYLYWRQMYSSKPVGGNWSTPAVAVQGRWNSTLSEYETCYNCKMDVDDDGVPHFLYWASLLGSVGGGPDLYMAEVRHQTGVLGGYTALYHYDNYGDYALNRPSAKALSISVKRGLENCLFYVIGDPAAGSNFYENGSVLAALTDPYYNVEAWCDNGPGGYTRMVRDGASWSTNFGTVSGLYNFSSTMTADGQVHVAGMNSSWRPQYQVYAGGAQTEAHQIEVADVASWMFVQVDTAAAVWVLWTDYDNALPHAVKVDNLAGIYEYPGPLSISGDSDSWGACAAGYNVVAWGGLDATMQNQVWIELKPAVYSSWHIVGG